MSAQALLDKLAKVRATGRGSWMAACPAHQDKSPSLTIREVDDGRVLFHCFAGCGWEDVLGAVGVNPEELFPPKPIENVKPMRRPFPAADILESLSHESTVVMLAARDTASGKVLDEASLLRLATAVQRIEEGRRLANG